MRTNFHFVILARAQMELIRKNGFPTWYISERKLYKKNFENLIF